MLSEEENFAKYYVRYLENINNAEIKENMKVKRAEFDAKKRKIGN